MCHAAAMAAGETSLASPSAALVSSATYLLAIAHSSRCSTRMALTRCTMASSVGVVDPLAVTCVAQHDVVAPVAIEIPDRLGRPVDRPGRAARAAPRDLERPVAGADAARVAVRGRRRGLGGEVTILDVIRVGPDLAQKLGPFGGGNREQLRQKRRVREQSGQPGRPAYFRNHRLIRVASGTPSRKFHARLPRSGFRGSFNRANFMVAAGVGRGFSPFLRGCFERARGPKLRQKTAIQSSAMTKKGLP